MSHLSLQVSIKLLARATILLNGTMEILAQSSVSKQHVGTIREQALKNATLILRSLIQDVTCMAKPNFDCTENNFLCYPKGQICRALPERSYKYFCVPRNVCGNSFVEPGEECDNDFKWLNDKPDNNDGCSENCKRENYWTCSKDSQDLSVCTKTRKLCGDGKV